MKIFGIFGSEKEHLPIPGISIKVNWAITARTANAEPTAKAVAPLCRTDIPGECRTIRIVSSGCEPAIDNPYRFNKKEKPGSSDPG